MNDIDITNSTILDKIYNLNNWDYYKKEKEHKLINKEDWSCQKSHIQFIKEYLTVGGKSGILNNFDISNFDSFDRAIHTNSVFFLGCLLYDELNLKNKIKFYREDENDEFYFVWFLSSLVHDFGYEVEEDKKRCKVKNNDISIITKDLQYNLLEYNKDTSYLNKAYTLVSLKTQKAIKAIEEYFIEACKGNKSSQNRKKIDHGIFSGLKLYDSLVKNRVERKSQKINEDNNLYWGKDIEEFYAIASFHIAIHNMRIPNIKYSINDEPFLFLFGLADTIEPTKTYEEYNAKYVLENIIIDFKSDKIIVIKNKEGSQLDFLKLQEKIEGLEKWLELRTDKPSSGEIIIQIN